MAATRRDPVTMPLSTLLRQPRYWRWTPGVWVPLLAILDLNAPLAFGHGIPACLGVRLTRLEAWIALADLRERLGDFVGASAAPWESCQALHVHGPARLPIRFVPGRRVAASA